MKQAEGALPVGSAPSACSAASELQSVRNERRGGHYAANDD